MGATSSAVLAECCQWRHDAFMGIQITIRDVPEKVRDELAARAALQGKSMQEYLRGELERIAGRPSAEAWLRSVRERKDAAGTRVSASKILSARDADRK
jgi:antitoxin FitA